MVLVVVFVILMLVFVLVPESILLHYAIKFFHFDANQFLYAGTVQLVLQLGAWFCNSVCNWGPGSATGFATGSATGLGSATGSALRSDQCRGTCQTVCSSLQDSVESKTPRIMHTGAYKLGSLELHACKYFWPMFTHASFFFRNAQ